MTTDAPSKEATRGCCRIMYQCVGFVSLYYYVYFVSVAFYKITQLYFHNIIIIVVL